MLRNKKTDVNLIDMMLIEARSNFISVEHDYEILENKGWRLVQIYMFALGGVLGFLMQKTNDILFIKISLLIALGLLISLFFLYMSIKSTIYHANGVASGDLEKQNTYYHDLIGAKLYYIYAYEYKAKDNCNINRNKGKYCNLSIITTFIFLFSSILIYFINFLCH